MAKAVNTVAGLSLKRTDGSVIMLDEAEQGAILAELSPAQQAEDGAEPAAAAEDEATG